MEFKRYPANDQELQTVEVGILLGRIKSFIRNQVEQIFEAAQRHDEFMKKLQKETVREELKQSYVPHELGTVTEIATRYNISKSEVRRRKADGTLAEFLNGLQSVAKA